MTATPHTAEGARLPGDEIMLTLEKTIADPTILPGSVIGGSPPATFTAELTLYSPDGARCRTLTGTVDTRMFYTVIPAPILAALSIVPQCEQRVHFPDNSAAKLPVAWAPVTLQGKSGTALVAFGKDAAPTVIGKETLIGLAFAADPENRRFIPALLHL